MKKYVILMTMSIFCLFFQIQPTQMKLKAGGATNKVAIAFFKSKSQYEALMAAFDVTKSVSDVIAQNTQKYAKVVAGIAAGGAAITEEGVITVVSAGTATVPGLLAASATDAGVYAAVDTGLNIFGSTLEKYGPSVARQIIKQFASEYFDDVRAGTAVCKGIGKLRRDKHLLSSFHSVKIPVIDKKVSFGSFTIPGTHKKIKTPLRSDEKITIDDPKPIYCVIFNKEKIDIQGLQARRYQIIYADYLIPIKSQYSGQYMPAGGPFASYEIDTYFLEVLITNQDGTPMIGDNGRPITKRTLTATMNMLNPTGGITCK